MSNIPIQFGGGICEESGATGSTVMTTVPVHGSVADSKAGTPTELIASTGFDYNAIIVTAVGESLNNTFMDIMIGSGTELVLIPDLLVPGFVGTGAGPETYIIPVKVPKGSRLSVRGQSSSTTAGASVQITGLSGGNYDATGSQVIAMGLDFATTDGTFLDAGGTANTKPTAWTEIEASISHDIHAVMVLIGSKENSSMSTYSFYFDLGIGATSSEIALIEDQYFNTNSAYDSPQPMAHGWYPVNIPAGSEISMRIQCNGTNATNRVVEVAVYGLTK